MSHEYRLPYARLVETIRNALDGAAVPPAIAEVEAQVMAEADLLGVPSHGVRMLPGLLRGIREGRVTANPRIKLERERAATCVLDGDNGPGRFISVRAMEEAVERARKFGVGACLATRLSHWGRAHAYAWRAAQTGMAGLCTTNAMTNMLGWGSSGPLLGNNPLAIAVPRGAGKEPLALDMAMSQAAVGKIGTFVREGKKAPAGWGLDSSGKPSDDPAAILSSGRVLPFGEHKGAGLSLLMEMLTGALSGGMLSFEMVRADRTGLDPNSSKLFLALEIQSFTDPERFARRVEDFAAYLRSAEPGLAITLPGERGWQTRERYLIEGIPLHAEVVTQLEEVGVALPG